MINSDERAQLLPEKSAENKIAFSLKDEDRTRGLILFSILFTILIALPLWWKSTEVYRANLPDEEIKAWREGIRGNLKFPITLEFNVANSESISNDDWKVIEKALVSTMNAEVEESIQKFPHRPRVIFSFTSVLRPWSVSEKDFNHLNNTELLLTSQTEARSEKILGQTFKVFVGFRQGENSPRSTIRLFNESVILMIIKNATADKTQRLLISLFQDIFISEYRRLLLQVCSITSESIVTEGSELRKLMKYSPHYEILHSLLNEDPRGLVLDWSIESTIEKWMQPLLQGMGEIHNFTVLSQVLNYAQPKISRKKYQDGKDGEVQYQYYDSSELSNFVNTMEWNLASFTTLSPSIQFLTFVPSLQDQPVYIKENDNVSELNAFMIPQWGGISILNVKELASEDRKSLVLSEKDLKIAFGAYLYQLRQLLGLVEISLPSLASKVNVVVDVNLERGFTDWEFGAIRRLRTAQMFTTAVSTLSSLSSMVSSLPHMTVQDSIGALMDKSLKNLKQTTLSAENGDMSLAWENAQEAATLAEKAFFDPNMVSMMYFPDEHKYVMYLPLFLPIGIPVLFAFLKEFKLWKRKKQQQKQHTE